MKSFTLGQKLIFIRVRLLLIFWDFDFTLLARQHFLAKHMFLIWSMNFFESKNFILKSDFFFLF